MNDGLALGVDLGGTKIAFALVDAEGRVAAEQTVPTEAASGPEAVMDRIAGGIQTLSAQAGSRLVGVGIGSPGYIDAENGVVLNAVNLQWRDVALVGGLRARLSSPVPVWLRKDADAGTLGERWFGAGRGSDHFVYLALGTGLGMSALVHGRLMTGATHGGMELAHVSLVPGGRPCPCGLRGCAETYLSGVGLLAGWREFAPQYPDSPLSTVENITTAALIEGFHAGDPLATRVIDSAAAMLVTVATITIGAINPARIILAGGLGAALQPVWLKALHDGLPQTTLPIGHSELKILPSEVESSAVGAAALVWQETAAVNA